MKNTPQVTVLELVVVFLYSSLIFLELLKSTLDGGALHHFQTNKNPRIAKHVYAQALASLVGDDKKLRACD